MIDRSAQLRRGTERDFVGYGRAVPKVRWPNDSRLALNLIVNYEEGSERNFLEDGVNEAADIGYQPGDEYRDLSTEHGFEYGSRAGVWRLLNLFREYGIQTTFFACGQALERNPEVAKALVAEDHEPCSHGYRWSEQWKMTRDEEREEIRRGVASIRDTCGERPLGWYCRYGPSINTRELLVEEGGFLYDSNAYNDDLPYFVTIGEVQHLVVPYTHTYNDGRFQIAPTYGSPAAFVDNVTRGIKELWSEGATAPKMMSVGLHPRIVGQASRLNALREIIEYALELGDIWIARRDHIARWWIDNHESFEAVQ